MTTTILEQPIRVYKLTAEAEPYSVKAARFSSHGKPYEETSTDMAVLNENKLFSTMKMPVRDTINTVVTTLRDPIADMQEKRGVSRYANSNFLDLIVSLTRHTYAAVIGMVMMVMGLMPLLEGILALARFVLDKILEINNTENINEKVFKTVIFVFELGLIFAFVSVICAVILLPVVNFIKYICLTILRIRY